MVAGVCSQIRPAGLAACFLRRAYARRNSASPGEGGKAILVWSLAVEVLGLTSAMRQKAAKNVIIDRAKKLDHFKKFLTADSRRNKSQTT
jgi:hypothetical protein